MLSSSKLARTADRNPQRREEKRPKNNATKYPIAALASHDAAKSVDWSFAVNGPVAWWNSLPVALRASDVTQETF